ncbi:MAG: basic secretory family protein [Proteiniphilum sp.]|nr:basic secretory family protein [Proteiniphilum sp.]
MTKQLLLLLTITFMLFSCGTKNSIVSNEKIESWDRFHYPEIHFVNKAIDTEGASIYERIVPDPQQLIRVSILGVVKTLYWSLEDSIPAIRKINYTIEDVKGISAKGGGVPEISIFYSSRWVEQSAKKGGDDKVLYETAGVLYHELTHGFQLEPQGIGSYGTNKIFFTFIEGMADAVRAHNGYFPATNRKPGGHWLDGYQTTGFFLEWLTTKDNDFLRKFNQSTLEVIPWSFDGAIKHVLGEQHSIETLWNEYQNYLTNINA